MPPPVVILGPQRHKPTLLSAMGRVGVAGPLSAVTVGWEERESEVQRLESHLGAGVVRLGLHRRSEEIAERDPEFADAWLARRERLRQFGDVYRQRLAHLMRSVRELLRRKEDDALLDPEREEAIEAVRRLDALRMRRLEEFHAEFEDRWRPGERESVAFHRTEVAALVAETGGVAIAGGNVAVLLNRMGLFDVPALLPGRPVFAWSAGAMALTERVVMFHDDPPIGVGNAEILGPGLGLVPGIVALPHAHRRLRLQDRVRVSAFARRFAPARCVAMEDGAAAAWDGRKWTVLEQGLSVLGLEGTLEPWGGSTPKPRRGRRRAPRSAP